MGFNSEFKGLTVHKTTSRKYKKEASFALESRDIHHRVGTKIPFCPHSVLVAYNP